jgi:flagellar motor component MotA
VAVDERGKLPGRGAYICARRECLDKAKKNKSLARALKTEVSGELYDQLEEYIETYKETHGTADVQRELRSLLGLARRAGLLHIGIDSVKSQCVKEPLLILTAADSSEAVKDIVRKQVESLEYRHVHVCAPLNVEAFSAAIGAAGVQVMALPVRNGLADKIKMLLPDGRGA